jgi:hypothetical protein
MFKTPSCTSEAPLKSAEEAENSWAEPLPEDGVTETGDAACPYILAAANVKNTIAKTRADLDAACA